MLGYKELYLLGEIIVPGHRRPGFTLRALQPAERDIQAGVLRLASLHRGVTLAVRANAGGGVVVRPPPGANGWERLHKEIAGARAAGFFAWPNPVAWLRLAPKNTPDVLGVMASGHGMAIEVKKPGGRRDPGQRATIDAVVRAGGLGAFVESVDETNSLFNAWERNHEQIAA